MIRHVTFGYLISWWAHVYCSCYASQSTCLCLCVVLCCNNYCV